MEVYRNVKIYSNGSYNVGIPYEPKPFKRKKATKNILSPRNEISKESNISVAPETENNFKTLFDNLYEKQQNKKRKEKYENILDEFEKHLDKEKAKEIVDSYFERKKRNLIERRKRFVRKVRQQNWDYFVTFTYDDKLHTEESFRKTLSNTLKHLSSRKGWKYAGVWERSPEKQRLHFHGLFIIPQMVGDFEEINDYSTKNHQMQTTNQNTYFLKKFGRIEFKKVENNHELNDSIRYLMKYLEKSGERIVYSRGLYTYYITDVLEDDVICRYGLEDKKLLLIDNFKCMDLETGEFLGYANSETIKKLKKSN